MNYYAARELEGTGKYHYTCRRDGMVWPVGYCKEHEPHATKEEACECYRKYLHDVQLQFGEIKDQQIMVAECGEWTTKIGVCERTSVVHLCDKHLSREFFEKHFGKFSEIMASW